MDQYEETRQKLWDEILKLLYNVYYAMRKKSKKSIH
jgi:hypothetical protein